MTFSRCLIFALLLSIILEFLPSASELIKDDISYHQFKSAKLKGNFDHSITPTAAVNTQSWMHDMFDMIGNIPLRHVAIPGTHDSLTFNITHNSVLAPDCEELVRELWKLREVPREILDHILVVCVINIHHMMDPEIIFNYAIGMDDLNERCGLDHKENLLWNNSRMELDILI